MSVVSEPRHSLVATQVVFFACILACVVVDPSHQADSNGISYYGVHAPTLPLVAIGYVVGSIGVWRTARYVQLLDAPAVVGPGLRLVALALPAELLTPFNHGPFLNWTHMGIGVVIGVTQMLAGTVLMVRRPGPLTRATFLVQLVGGLIAAASLPSWGINQMILGEVIFALGFSGCLVRWTYETPVESASRAQIEAP